MKLVNVLFWFAAIACVATARAEGCRELSEYQIEEPVSFERITTSDAVAQLLQGTSLTSAAHGMSGKRVSANAVRGRLDKVLGNLAASIGAKVVQDGCAVKLIASDLFQWKVEEGASLRGTLEAWSAKYGWTLAWGLGESDYQIGGGMPFEGEFHTAVEALLQAVNASVIEEAKQIGGKSEVREIRARFFNGNSVLRISY